MAILEGPVARLHELQQHPLADAGVQRHAGEALGL